MPDSFYVRPYVPFDQPQVRWLHDRTPPAGQASARPNPWPEALNRISQHFAAFWVAVEQAPSEDIVVGIAGLEDGTEGGGAMGVPVPQFLSSAARTARLEAVRVAPERQRRGIGRLLSETAIAWAREHGYERVILDTSAQQGAAIALYEAMGFQEAGRTTFRQWELVWFELDLSGR